MPLNVRIRPRTQTNEPVVSYIYSFSGGVVDTTTLPEHQHTFSAAGLQTIQVQIATHDGCTAASVPKEVTVNEVCDSDGGDLGGGGGGGGPLQVARGSGCDDKYTFTFHDTTSNVTVESWNFAGDLIVTNQNPITYTFPDMGIKRFLVTATLRENPPGTAIIEHKINVRVVDEKANYRLDRSDICKGLDIGFETIDIDSSNIRNYIWDFGADIPRRVIDNEEHFNDFLTYLNGDTRYTYLDTGRFETKLIIEDKFGCKDSIGYLNPVTVKGPLANLEAAQDSVCGNAFAVALKDASVPNGSVPIVSRTWDFGDGAPTFDVVNDTTILHQYTHTSYYREFVASLTVTDGIGCTDRSEQRIRSFAPKAKIFSYDTLRCGKFDIFFYNQSSALVSDNSRFTWSYGDGITTHGYYGNHTFPDTGQYTISLKVVDDGGCVDSVAKVGYVKLVRPEASFTIGADTSKCVGTFSLPLVSTSTYGRSYLWDFGDGSTSQTTNIEVSHFYERAGRYDISLSVTGLDGCTDQITQQVRIKGPRGDLNIGEHYLCVGSTFSAEVQGENIRDFYWDFDDLSPTTDLIKQSLVNHEYQQPGKYVPNVILLSPENCQITLEAQDTVFVDLLDAGMPANIECGDTFTSIQGSAALNIAGNYHWEGPPGATYLPGNTSLLTQVDTPGQYFLKMSVGLCDHPDTVLVTTSGIVPTADAGTDAKIDCIEDQVALQGSTTTADTHFVWEGPEGAVFTPSEIEPSPVVTIPGEYVLTVIQKECITKDTVMISPCSLRATDTPLELCANLPGTPFRYASYDLTQLDDIVIGGVSSRVSWYRDEAFLQPINNPLTHDVVNNDTYFARITSMDGTETDRARVSTLVHSYVDATIQFNQDTICESDAPVLLTPKRWSGDDLTFEWFYNNSPLQAPQNTPQTLNLALPYQSGQYILKVSNSYCAPDFDSLDIKIYESPELSFPNPFINALYSPGSTVLIPLAVEHSTPNEISAIQWSPDQFLAALQGDPPVLQPMTSNGWVQQPYFVSQNQEQSLTYEVSVTAGKCTTKASVVVNNYIPVKIPNAFTPNGDGLNDTWVISGLAKYPKTQVKVLNQWGQLLFEDRLGYLSPWNGLHKNEQVPFGTYYYIIDFKGSNDGSDYSEKGWLIVME